MKVRSRSFRRKVIAFTFGGLVISAGVGKALQADEDPQLQAYLDDEIFEQLSGGARTLLEAKFGRRTPEVPPLAEAPAPEGARAPAVMAAATPPPNILVNDPTLDTTARDTQSETSIVLGAGNVVLVGFNDSGSFSGIIPPPPNDHFTGWSRSVNGGATFTDMGKLPNSPNGDAGDPVLARDNTSGRVYFSTLCFSGPCLQVFRSNDNGATFGPPVNAAPGTGGFNDKQWIAVDNFPGPGQGNVYVGWRNFISGGSGSNRMEFTRSTDGGNTFGPLGGLDINAGGGQGAFVTVGPDHSVYYFWWDVTGLTRSILMRKSTNQGVSFGPPLVVAPLIGTGVNGNLALNGGFRSNSFPHAAVNPVNGFYLVWGDNRLANPNFPAHAKQPDVRFAKLNLCAPPTISDASADPASLWPPNHKLRDVTVDYKVTANCPATCTLSVTSDEGTNAHEPDSSVVDDHHVQLRAERDGGGDGRTYTITITCTNSAGSATKDVTVAVPHDQRK